MEYFTQYTQLFLLILVRMLALLTVAPMYSTTVIPFQVRAGASFVITALLFPLVADMRLTVPNEFIPYVLTVANEVMIGLLIGFLLSIIFAAFQTAARFFEVQMGFGVTDTLDPLSQISIPIIGQFQNLIATLVFISVKGHHLVILALYESYKKLPVLGNASKTVFTAKSGTVIDVILTFSASMFSIALKLAFPMIATLFLLSLSLGLLAKAAPQMNILMLGFPVQVGLGIITYMVITPMLVGTIATVIQTTFIDITRVLGGLGAVSP